MTNNELKTTITKKELTSRLESIANYLETEDDEFIQLYTRRLYSVIKDIKNKDILE